MSSKAQCKSGKVAYSSESVASSALDYLIKAGVMTPSSTVYQCDKCKQWHSTSPFLSIDTKGAKHLRIMKGKRQKRTLKRTPKFKFGHG
jgi:hypothetical protein